MPRALPALLDQAPVLSGLHQMLLYCAGQLPVPDDVRALAEQLDRLRLDRVRVAQVTVQLVKAR
jgi:hypothetical protein